MNINKKLLMAFQTISGKKVSVSVDDPRNDLDEAEIKSAMDLILARNIFRVNGEPFVALIDAKIVETATTEYDLVL